MFSNNPWGVVGGEWVYGRWELEPGHRSRESYWMHGTIDGSRADLIELLKREREYDTRSIRRRVYPTQKMK